MEIAFRTHFEDYAKLRGIQTYFEQELKTRISDIEINGEETERMPNTTNVSCHFVEGESILYELSEYGICASSGSACTSGSLEPSHVLRAMKVPFTAIHGSTRFSFSRYNSQEEVDRILDIFPEIIARLRAASPFSRENRH